MSLWQNLIRFAAPAVCALGIAGCGGGLGGGFLDNIGSRTANESSRSVAIAPIVGVPGEIGSELTQKLEEAAKQQRVRITVPGEGDYNLRGYLAAANDQQGVRITYIWDVTDKAGARAYRITGEEMVPRRGDNMWAGVSGYAAQRIADKTAADLSAWLAGGAVPGAQPVATAPPQQDAAPAPPPPQAQQSGGQFQQDNIAASGDAPTFIAPASGAPGDGSVALQDAMRRKLVGRGVNVAGSPSIGAYTVRGVVSVKQGEGDKDSVRIDWQVIDPSGRRLGTVSQQRAVQKGALEGTWGGMAEAAAGAATEGVMKWLPQPRS